MEKVASFAERLKQAMYERNIRASKLSLLTNISHVSISHYLHGKYEANAINLAALASALSVDPLWLMGFNVNKNPPNIELQAVVKTLNEKQAEQVLKYINVFILNKPA